VIRAGNGVRFRFSQTLALRVQELAGDECLGVCKVDEMR
jgi:hypothetical protein